MNEERKKDASLPKETSFGPNPHEGGSSVSVVRFFVFVRNFESMHAVIFLSLSSTTIIFINRQYKVGSKLPKEF